MSRPKVFVSRRIPAAGLDRITAACDAEVWQDPLPPPADVLTSKLAAIDGLVSLLTDKLTAAVLDSAALSVNSHVNSPFVRPKWPKRAVSLYIGRRRSRASCLDTRRSGMSPCWGSRTSD